MSLNDYEKYIKNVFLNGSIFENKATYDKFISKGFEVKSNRYSGFGLFHNVEKYETIGHDGGHDGYNSQIMYYPEKKLVVATFYGTNTVALDFLSSDIVRCFE